MSIFKLFHKEFTTPEAYRAYLAMPFFSRQLIFHPVRSLFCLFLIGAGSIKGYVEHVQPLVTHSSEMSENILSSHFIVEGRIASVEHRIEVMPVASFKTTVLGDRVFPLNGDSLISDAQRVPHCENSGYNAGEKATTPVDEHEGDPFHVTRYIFFAREFFGEKDKWASMYQYDTMTGCLTLLDVDYENARKVYWGNRMPKGYYGIGSTHEIKSYPIKGYDIMPEEENVLFYEALNKDNRFK